MSWLSVLRQKFRRCPPPYPLIGIVDYGGVSEVQHDVTARIAWQDIVCIIAHKSDCFAFDDIRLVLSDGTSQIECSESQQSFVDLDLAIKAHLRLEAKDWLERLMRSPAFEATTTIVYKRLSCTHDGYQDHQMSFASMG